MILINILVIDDSESDEGKCFHYLIGINNSNYLNIGGMIMESINI